MIYLATPYTHPDPKVMQQRFDAACRAAGALMARGMVVFSPIAHTHPIAVACELPRDWDYWRRFDREFIAVADAVWVVMIDGYWESRGVQAEIQIAHELGKYVEFVSMSDLERHEG